MNRREKFVRERRTGETYIALKELGHQGMAEFWLRTEKENKEKDMAKNDELNEEIRVSCPWCSTNVVLIKEKEIRYNFFGFRGGCSGCSRPISLYTRADGIAQRQYGEKWQEKWGDKGYYAGFDNQD